MIYVLNLQILMNVHRLPVRMQLHV